MKSLKILSLSAPIATCAFYWFDLHKKNIPLNYSILQASDQKMELEQVQVIFRHGARTPMNYWTNKAFQGLSNIEPEIWDKDKLMKVLPWTDIDYTVKLQDDRLGTSTDAYVQLGPTTDAYRGQVNLKGGCYSGQLTCVGQQQIYDLGKWLSQEYVVNHGLISPSYQKNEVSIRSTYFKRTIQSAVCLLAGLYGKETLTEPIYIDTKHVEKEDLYCNYIGCANFIKWFIYVIYKEAHTPEEDELEETMNMLTGKKKDGESVNMVAIHDLILCRQAHGLYVPQFLLEKEEALRKYALWIILHILGNGNAEHIKVCIGSFLDTLCCRIDEAIEGSSQSKMLLYCAHDWSLLSILLALGVDIKVWPSFGSHLILELYKREDGERFIRVLHNGEPIQLDSKTGEHYLPIQKFMNLLKVYRVSDWDKDCGNLP